MRRACQQRCEENPTRQIKINGAERAIDADPQMPLFHGGHDLVAVNSNGGQKLSQRQDRGGAVHLEDRHDVSGSLQYDRKTMS